MSFDSKTVLLNIFRSEEETNIYIDEYKKLLYKTTNNWYIMKLESGDELYCPVLEECNESLSIDDVCNIEDIAYNSYINLIENKINVRSICKDNFIKKYCKLNDIKITDQILDSRTSSINKDINREDFNNFLKAYFVFINALKAKRVLQLKKKKTQKTIEQNSITTLTNPQEDQ